MRRRAAAAVLTAAIAACSIDRGGLAASDAGTGGGSDGGLDAPLPDRGGAEDVGRDAPATCADPGTTCDGDDQVVCDEMGREVRTPCALGCVEGDEEEDPVGCRDVSPSNVGGRLAE